MENANIATGVFRGVHIFRIKSSAIESLARTPARINGAKRSLLLTWTIRTTSGKRRNAGWPKTLTTGDRIAIAIPNMSRRTVRNSANATGKEGRLRLGNL